MRRGLCLVKLRRQHAPVVQEAEIEEWEERDTTDKDAATFYRLRVRGTSLHSAWEVFLRYSHFHAFRRRLPGPFLTIVETTT